jgi:hypothetical protein
MYKIKLYSRITLLARYHVPFRFCKIFAPLKS